MTLNALPVDAGGYESREDAMEARYQCLGVDGSWIWRLLGSNHRELARASNTFPSEELAAEDALAVGKAARTAPIEIMVDADTSWRWTLVIDGQPRATSHLHYARRLECLRAVARFRECGPLATVTAPPLVHRRFADRPRRSAGQSPGDRSR